jgi:hypothetical protein
VHQVGLNSPMSACSSTKADDKKHTFHVHVGLPASLSKAAAEEGAHSSNGAIASVLKESVSPASNRNRSKAIQDETLHRWAMEEAASIIAQQQAQSDDSVVDAGVAGLYKSHVHKKDKEREYVARIMSEAMQRHLRAHSPPSGEALQARILEMKGAARSDVEAAPHPLAAGTRSHILNNVQHKSHVSRHSVMDATRVHRARERRQAEEEAACQAQGDGRSCVARDLHLPFGCSTWVWMEK